MIYLANAIPLTRLQQNLNTIAAHEFQRNHPFFVPFKIFNGGLDTVTGLSLTRLWGDADSFPDTATRCQVRRPFKVQAVPLPLALPYPKGEGQGTSSPFDLFTLVGQGGFCMTRVKVYEKSKNIPVTVTKNA